MEDHDLLQRIDERMGNVVKRLDSLSASMKASEVAIVNLRVEAAKWGAFGGIAVSVVMAMIAVGINAVFKT
jgi:hypothetical protein